MVMRTIKKTAAGHIRNSENYIVTTDNKGQLHHINAIKLLYNCDYSLVVFDAEAILTEYDVAGKFSIANLHS